MQEAIASLLGPGDVFYDIGANVGFFSLVASRIVGPAGAVYAFEPLPEIAGAFEENLRLNNVSNVRVLRLAVSDRDGTARIQTTAHPGGATLEGYGTPGDTTGVITVETRTIDTLVQELGLRRPSVVKIDVEGAEAAVLRGMPALLSDHPVIVYELDGATADELETNRQEVELELRRTGYEISELPRSYGGTHLVRHYVAMA
ncbi:MAG: FkbM family methyltransferase [Dehalococcoidia bacterium]